MKTPMLVGLNDEIANSGLITNLRTCISSTNSASDVPLDYKYLDARSAWNTGDKARVNISLSIWANLHGFFRNQPSPDNMYEYTKPGVGIQTGDWGKLNIKSTDGFLLDLDSPAYTSLRYVPMFIDSFGNKIFIHIQDNRQHNVAWHSEMYGSKNKNDFIWIEHENKRNDTEEKTGWPTRTFVSYAFLSDDNNYYNIVKRLEAVGVGKQKLNKPVVVTISRDKGFTMKDLIPIVGYLLTALETATAVIGLGSVVEGIKTALNTCLKLASNPNVQLTADDVKTIGNALSPTLFEGGGAEQVVKYVNDGTAAYNAYKQNDYKKMAELTGINRFELQRNNLFDLNLITNNLSNFGTKTYDKQSGTMQTVRNLFLIDEMQKAGTNPEISGLMNTDSLTKGDETFAYMTMVSGGGYSGGLPTNIGGKEIMSELFKNIPLSEQTPMVHAQFMKASFGLPTGTAAFEELLLVNIENQIITKKLKSFTIPAQLPAAKALCIKEHLTKYGINVFYSGYTLDTKISIPPIPKEFTYKGKTNVRILRNFK